MTVNKVIIGIGVNDGPEVMRLTPKAVHNVIQCLHTCIFLIDNVFSLGHVNLD